MIRSESYLGSGMETCRVLLMFRFLPLCSPIKQRTATLVIAAWFTNHYEGNAADDGRWLLYMDHNLTKTKLAFLVTTDVEISQPDTLWQSLF